MTKFEGEPLLAQGKDNNRNEPKGFWAAVLRLYRGSTVWRGSCDMILIGGLVMILCLGFPDLIKLSIQNDQQGQTQTRVPNVKPAKEEMPTFKPLSAVNEPEESLPDDYPLKEWHE